MGGKKIEKNLKSPWTETPQKKDSSVIAKIIHRETKKTRRDT